MMVIIWGTVVTPSAHYQIPFDWTRMKESFSNSNPSDLMAPYTSFVVCLVGCRFQGLHEVKKVWWIIFHPISPAPLVSTSALVFIIRKTQIVVFVFLTSEDWMLQILSHQSHFRVIFAISQRFVNFSVRSRRASHMKRNVVADRLLLTLLA